MLRTRSEIAIVDTFSYDIFEIPFGYTAVEYRWMAKNEGMPVLQINSQIIFGFETITQVTYKTADVIDGIDNVATNENNFVVYPNPSSTSATIQFTTPENGKYVISISDLQGKIILEKNISALNGQNSIATDLQSFAAGTYLVSLFENNQLIASQKIIKN
ncbi:MAG TPA: T9SS type A sorting domain-containing protein [Chitinophagales bacterium]|nr:T9SS type A sorting domain-containing protein [Chitinophagales bacterium]